MKNFFIVVVLIAFFSCTSTASAKKQDATSQPDVGNAQPETLHRASDTEATVATGADGAPTYLLSENDRSKPFTKVGVGTGGAKAVLSPSVTASDGSSESAKPVSSSGEKKSDTSISSSQPAQTKPTEITSSEKKPSTPNASSANNLPTSGKDKQPATSGSTQKPQTGNASKATQPSSQTKPTSSTQQHGASSQVAKAETTKPAPSVQSTQSSQSQGNGKNYFGDADITDATNDIVEPTEAGYFSEFPQEGGQATDTIPVSRSTSMNQNQRIRVLYPGEKWVFLGEQTSQKGLNYEQRRFKSGDTEFTFYAKEAGDYILNFSRYDAYSNSFIKDALKVHVGDKISGAQPYVKAPDYVLPTTLSDTTALKPVLESKANTATTKPQVLKPTADLTVPNDTDTQVVPSTDLLEKAKKEIAAGDAKNAITDLNRFLRSSTNRLDEAYFYLGQAYELNGSEKNIKEAYKAYKTVTSAFIDSDFWQRSDERIRYIKRFFIDIE